MKLADLSPEIKVRIKKIRYDQIVEKHEGPWSYETEFEHEWKKDYKFADEASRLAFEQREAEYREKYKDAEFLDVEGRWVLLPLGAEHYPNITFLRVHSNPDDTVLTMFFTDATFKDYWGENAGFIAIAEKFPNQNFFVTTVYHEWFTMPSLEAQLARLDEGSANND